MNEGDVTREYRDYARKLVEQLWAYREERFADQAWLFDARRSPSPPVFESQHAHWNVLTRPDSSPEERRSVWEELPAGRQHRWFRSLKSSQALAQSVFANLKVSGKLQLLSEITGEDGKPLFLRHPAEQYELALDHPIDYLGEPRPTSVDVLFSSGSYKVAVECKLSEAAVGACSRPHLQSDRSNYQRDHCDGSYSYQRGRAKRCVLGAIGVAYWEHVPKLFEWSGDRDHTPCPLNENYQLVRNVLAACVRSEGGVGPDGGHAVLLYDERNPHFRPGGAVHRAYQAVREALREPTLLQLCTWQQITAVLRQDRETTWLADALRSKYGL